MYYSWTLFQGLFEKILNIYFNEANLVVKYLWFIILNGSLIIREHKAFLFLLKRFEWLPRLFTWWYINIIFCAITKFQPQLLRAFFKHSIPYIISFVLTLRTSYSSICHFSTWSFFFFALSHSTGSLENPSSQRKSYSLSLIATS